MHPHEIVKPQRHLPNGSRSWPISPILLTHPQSTIIMDLLHFDLLPPIRHIVLQFVPMPTVGPIPSILTFKLAPLLILGIYTAITTRFQYRPLHNKLQKPSQTTCWKKGIYWLLITKLAPQPAHTSVRMALLHRLATDGGRGDFSPELSRRPSGRPIGFRYRH